MPPVNPYVLFLTGVARLSLAKVSMTAITYHVQLIEQEQSAWRLHKPMPVEGNLRPTIQ